MVVQPRDYLPQSRTLCIIFYLLLRPSKGSMAQLVKAPTDSVM
jgi:hypothetical protein